MTVALRPYQQQAEAGIYQRWQQHRNVLAVLPTGAGKTVLFSKVLRDTHGPSIAIAHRQELVSQISLALGRNEVRHAIIAPDKVRAGIEALHMLELGRRWVDQSARCGVAGVDTLVRRDPAPWMHNVQRWVCDEAHHLLRENKWGKAVTMFPNAYGLGVTATPTRADGKGLGAHAGGVFGAMVTGPSMADLIAAGYLTPFKVYAPPSDLNLKDVDVGDSGDYVQSQVRKAVHKSHITGDVVKHYLRLAPGKLGVTFAVDVEAATEIMVAFRAAGVPAEVVTAKTPDALRVSILRRFRNREILQLVNVDLFGEGFDLPAIEVVSMARPTMSYALYCQQFGRALRLLDGKTHAIIIDHVGNCYVHGLPTAPRRWTLDARESCGRGASDVMPVTTCTECGAVYERFNPSCPYCGSRPTPASRSSPAFVDGDLFELDPDVLRALGGEIARIDGACYPPTGLDGIAQRAVHNKHRERQRAQHDLRHVMGLYGGWRQREGDSPSMTQRRFFHTMGVDVMTAQTLGAREATELRDRIAGLLTEASISVTMAPIPEPPRGLQ